MITNDHSWSLGPCPNKSLVIESSARPHQPSGHLRPKSTGSVCLRPPSRCIPKFAQGFCIPPLLEPLTLNLQPSTAGSPARANTNQHKSAPTHTHTFLQL